jgi:nicotinamidase-related amidase
LPSTPSLTISSSTTSPYSRRRRRVWAYRQSSRTVGALGSVLVDPIFKEISEIFPEITPIDRTSTHAWSHPEVRAAVDATGRKKLIMAGLATEVCLAQSALAALRDEFDVYFVSDCSAGVNQEAHEDAKVRMTMAGAKPMSLVAVINEWTPDYATPERAALAGPLSRRGGTWGLLVDYAMAQVAAGLGCEVSDPLPHPVGP